MKIAPSRLPQRSSEQPPTLSSIPLNRADYAKFLKVCKMGIRNPGRHVTKADLSDLYRNYIACLNKQDWASLERYVGDHVHYNGQRIGLAGYREMLERDFLEIPDLHFNIALLISDPPYIASRLAFACSPIGKFLGLPIYGKRVSFTENVFYEFRTEKIERVWSVIDKAAIEAQLQG